jgi:alkylation response protein AidB-like acyl-CoA dehydrogenase
MAQDSLRKETDLLIERSGELAEKVAASADKIDHDRMLPEELAHELADEGFFRLLVPRSLGGAEIGHSEFLRIVRTFARADASTAWCVNQNNVVATDSARMPLETARTIWGEQRAVVANGPPTPETKAVRAEGGYRVSGRWNFSSGSNLATWMAARAPVEPARDGSSGKPVARMLLLPKSEVTMLDFWQVNGLRGTASFSFEARDVFVPEAHSYLESGPSREAGPLYVIPKVPLFAMGFATIAVTVARACLEDALDLAGRKAPRDQGTLLRDHATTQRLIGESEAVLTSAELFLQTASDMAWQHACDFGELPLAERMQVRLATTHAIRQAWQVTRTCYDIYGSDAIFTGNAIQRRYQDMSAITQHIQGRPANYETAGQFFLGLEPRGVF